MIRVERSTEPAVLERRATRGKHKGLNEREAVIRAIEAHREAQLPADEFKFDFDVYGEDDVKSVLGAGFAGKCAYCETYYSASQPMDVEHWRPKGEVHVRKNDDDDEWTVLKPGYYWLASDWDNLFPSCIDCNRGRYQDDLLLGQRLRIGKANQFPLAEGSPRVLDHGQDVGAERPLLLDPCEDDPEAFFAYTQDGVIEPLDDLDEPDRKRALASIHVYALNRSGLVAERLEVIRRIDHRIKLIGELTGLRGDLEQREPELAELVAQLIHAESKMFDEMMKPSSPFAGLARFLIRQARQSAR